MKVRQHGIGRQGFRVNLSAAQDLRLNREGVLFSTPFPPLLLHCIDNNSNHQVAASLRDLTSPSFLVMSASAVTAAGVTAAATGMATPTTTRMASATRGVSATARR